MISGAIIYVNFGPYHVARCRALAGLADIHPIFIELASRQALYPWEANKGSISSALITLTDEEYEATSRRNVTRKLISSLDVAEPDVVVISGYRERPMREAAHWARRRGRAVVLQSDTTPWDRPRVWWKEVAKRWWVQRFVDVGFVAGSPQRRYLVALGIPQTRTWEGCDVIDNEFFARETEKVRASSAEPARLGLPSEYFLYVGRFSPEKNVPILLKAYSLYRASDPEGWGLVVVGEGPDRLTVERLGEDLSLQDVVWTGFKNIEELPLYYALAGSLVLPSRSEPWGLVVNEAMASELPVIVSRRCGCAEDLVMEGKNGFLFDPEDPAALAEQMARIARLPEARRAEMGKASKEIVSAFTPETWAKNLTLAINAAVGAAAR